MKGKIFNAQEVQAILNGSKVMFREVIKPYPILSDDKSYWEFKGVRWAGENSSYAKNFGDNARPVMPDLCPYRVGQKIFCKERFSEELQQIYCKQLAKFNYAATCDEEVIKVDSDGWQLFRKNGDPASPWKPAQHMKQEHSRLTLEITDIKVERLAEISEEDAIKEGVNKLFTEEEMKHVLRVHQIEKNDTYKNYLWHGHIGRTITKKQSDEWEYQCSAYEKAKDSFFSFWNANHEKPEEKFEVNPFVWVVDFKINK